VWQNCRTRDLPVPVGHGAIHKNLRVDLTRISSANTYIYIYFYHLRPFPSTTISPSPLELAILVPFPLPYFSPFSDAVTTAAYQRMLLVSQQFLLNYTLLVLTLLFSVSCNCNFNFHTIQNFRLEVAHRSSISSICFPCFTASPPEAGP
jgi:hypothetical protein